jgi:hypothetical protein
MTRRRNEISLTHYRLVVSGGLMVNGRESRQLPPALRGMEVA